jgi:hypothetical protein
MVYLLKTFKNAKLSDDWLKNEHNMIRISLQRSQGIRSRRRRHGFGLGLGRSNNKTVEELIREVKI